MDLSAPLILAGVALALPYLLYAGRVRGRKQALGAGLVVAAAVYGVFAAVRGTPRELLVELGGVLLFGAVAYLGIRGSAWFLAAGWVMHVGWDLLLHGAGVPAYAPGWYPVVCVGFDLVVAGAIIGGMWRATGSGGRSPDG